MSWPATSTWPDAASSPASTISRLVLPEPDGPTMPTASPASMHRSMPRRMLTGPAAEGTVSDRSRVRTIGAARLTARPSGGDALNGDVLMSMAAPYGATTRRPKRAETV